MMEYILGRLVAWGVTFEKISDTNVRVYGNFGGSSVLTFICDGYVEVNGRIMNYEDFEDWLYWMTIK